MQPLFILVITHNKVHQLTQYLTIRHHYRGTSSVESMEGNFFLQPKKHSESFF
jgi:hypothetical protein